MRRGTSTALLIAAGSLAAAGVAGAAHWPAFGGDTGRSGNNDDAGSPPVTAKWTFDAPGRQIATPIVVSGGAGDARGVVFGSVQPSSDFKPQLHIRAIADGGHVAAIGVGSDADAFGGTGPSTGAVDLAPTPTPPPCNDGSSSSCRYKGVHGAVSPVVAGDGASPGQIYVVYNSGTAIHIRRVDATGATGRTETPSLKLDGTDGYTINSSPVLTPPDANGDQVLLFVASRDPTGGLDQQAQNRLFKVSIAKAASGDASIGAATNTLVSNANPFASPALAYLRISNSTVQHVLVSTGTGTTASPANAVRAYRVSDLQTGPAVTGLDGIPYTPAVRPAANGSPPGAEGSGSQGAQEIYVAIHQGANTHVLRLEPSGSGFSVAKKGPQLAGAPGPALAVDRLGTSDPSLAVTTGSHQYVLVPPQLAKVTEDVDGDFRDTAPAIARQHVYLQASVKSAPTPTGGLFVTRSFDNTQLTSDARGFEKPNDATGESRGQPALATGFAAFSVGSRVYAYDLVAPPAPPPPPNQAPTASFVLGPNPAATDSAVGFDARASSDPDGRIVNYRWDLDGDGTFERDTGDVPATVTGYPTPGTYDVGLQVTDDDGATDVTRRQLVVEAVERKAPRGLSVRVRPRSDATTPHRFRTRGQLLLPKGVTPAEGCEGRVTVVVKARRNTISRRARRIQDDCRYRSRVTFRKPRRFAGAKRLRFIVRFRGNDALEPIRAKTRKVRVR